VKPAVEGHLALGAAQLAFGLFPVIGTLAFAAGGVDALGLGVWRIAFGSLALGGLAVMLHGRASLPKRADLPLVALCAVLGVALNQGLFLTGLSLSTPMNAGLVMCMIPVFTFAFALMARQETFSPRRAAGVLLALAGVVPLVFGDGLSFGENGVGNALMVANAASYAAYLVLSKPLVARYPPLAVTAWAYIGSLWVLPFFAWNSTMLPSTTTAAAAMAYVLIFPTVLGYLANIYALKRVRASTTAVYVYVQPLIAGLGAWALFSEQPDVAMVGAAAALFLGIGLVSRS
jgi:drug/metabolite transporter (DMT)-like permease